MTPANDAPGACWIGTFDLSDGQAGAWRVGPSELRIAHVTREWRMFFVPGTDALDESCAVTLPLPEAETRALIEGGIEGAEVRRFSFREADPRVRLAPALADRPIVVRPETPLYVLPNESVDIYVSTPVWVQVYVGSYAHPMLDCPTHRLPDTWFGPSTREGELCYGARTLGRLRLDLMPLRPHRAVTPVRVHNGGSDALLVDRLQLPVQHLALYRGANGYIYTQSVALERQHSDESAAIRLGTGAPSEIGEDAKRLEPPRQATPSNVLIRRFGALFGRSADVLS